MRDADAPFDRVRAATPPIDEALRLPPRSWWRQPRRLLVGAAVLVLVVALVALFVIDARLAGRPDLSARAATGIADRQAKTAVSQLESQPATAVTVYRHAEPGLVLIRTRGTGASASGDLGSGVVVNTQGEILTALHVVQGASTIEVTFANGTSSPASIKTSEPAHDIAVLSAGALPSTIVPDVLGGGVQVGQEAFAVGNPLDLVASLSAGVVSGLDRSFSLTDGRTLSGMIQFDAAVNPGSSGGPLLNTQGQVVGIVTGLANPAGVDGFAGIGFAVPIATAGQAAGAPAK